MKAESQRLQAMLLTAVAAHGLVFAPLAHAEQHADAGCEAHAEEESSSRIWRALFSSGSSQDALAYALEHGHALAEERGAPAAGVRHAHHRHSRGAQGHSHSDSHSHGAGSGPHGAGSLSHFSLSLHGGAAWAAPLPPPLPHLPPPSLEGQLHSAPRYLVPERSQAPPRC